MIKKEILNDNTDITANSKQLEILKRHFPNCFDKNGAFIPYKMAEIVGENGLDLSRESYSLNWLGKSYARLLANLNPQTLLKEDKEHNAKEEHKSSQNLLIKGDNLEVLKHLKNVYGKDGGQVKMIYIDPPYNTGSDGFVYNDDRKFTPEQLSRLAGIELDEAKRILAFTASKSNSHSAWLTFMYPRLYIARELLREDGVIFISIDDNEQAQLKLLCDEIFGEENFISEVVWKKKTGAGTKIKHFFDEHEYVLVYAKNKERASRFRFESDGDGNFVNPDNDSRGNWESCAFTAPSKNKNKNQLYMIEVHYNKTNIETINELDEDGRKAIEVFKYNDHLVVLRNTLKTDDMSYSEYDAIKNTARFIRRWAYALNNVRIIFDENRVYFNNGNIPRFKKFEYEYDGKALKSIYYDEFSTQQGTDEIRKLFNKAYFEYPKPLKLIQLFTQAVITNDDIVLDFFAGSGTTAHAVMALNAEDSGKRRFITVQIDEPTKPDSEAYKDNYLTIFDITKARIEKSIESIKSEKPDYDGDLGFRIFETLPLFQGSNEEIGELGDGLELYDGSKRSNEELGYLLTTWKTYDGIELAEDLQPIEFAGYQGYTYGKNIYFMDKGFSNEALEAFIKALDEEPLFQPSKLVLYGYNFQSKFQRQISEGLNSYKNKKSIELDVVVRY